MNNMIFKVLFAFVVICPMSALGIDTSDADIEWAKLQHLRQDAISGDRLERIISNEKRRLEFREGGLRFWRKHLEDPRRVEWLISTLENPPAYFTNPQQLLGDVEWWRVEIRSDERLRWETIFEHLKHEFLALPGTTDEQRERLLRADIWDRINNKGFRRVRRGEPIDLESIQDTVLQFAEQCVDSHEPARVASLCFFEEGWLQSVDQKNRFIARMKSSSNSELRNMGFGKERLMRLFENRIEPLNIQLRSLDGSEVSLEALRGKVVLIDFWSTFCSSCIAEMPKIKTIYEKYRDNGFTVIGVSFDDETKRAKVAKLMRDMSIPWPQCLDDPKSEQSLWKRFGFGTLGELFVVDQNGILVANELGNVERLEPIIRKLFCLPPLGQSTGQSTGSGLNFLINGL